MAMDFPTSGLGLLGRLFFVLLPRHCVAGRLDKAAISHTVWTRLYHFFLWTVRFWAAWLACLMRLYGYVLDYLDSLWHWRLLWPLVLVEGNEMPNLERTWSLGSRIGLLTLQVQAGFFSQY
ncbi:hypothetical protein GE09DRAFT_1114328 [Coniochaeta sp. 2T2.1]|nr:hypothetical protein GE09DRAFT_1114328 [Coniochaeta sp. 2T2.1]